MVAEKITIMYGTILQIMLYGSECWALSKADTRKIDALNQWCLRRILDIRWYHRISNCELRCLTEQPPLTTITQKIKMVNGFRYYRALKSINIASALSTALYHLPMPDPTPSMLTV